MSEIDEEERCAIASALQVVRDRGWLGLLEVVAVAGVEPALC